MAQKYIAIDINCIRGNITIPNVFKELKNKEAATTLKKNSIIQTGLQKTGYFGDVAHEAAKKKRELYCLIFVMPWLYLRGALGNGQSKARSI